MNTDSGTDELDRAWDDPALAGLLGELRDLGSGPAPAVGPELADLLAGTPSLAAARDRRGRAAAALTAGLLATGVLAGGITAAAADELPAPVQRVVSRVVDTFTPFEVPHPDQRSPRDNGPADEDPGKDEGPAAPLEPTSPAPTPRQTAPTTTDSSDDDGSGESSEDRADDSGERSDDDRSGQVEPEESGSRDDLGETSSEDRVGDGEGDESAEDGRVAGSGDSDESRDAESDSEESGGSGDD